MTKIELESPENNAIHGSCRSGRSWWQSDWRQPRDRVRSAASLAAIPPLVVCRQRSVFARIRQSPKCSLHSAARRLRGCLLKNVPHLRAWVLMTQAGNESSPSAASGAHRRSLPQGSLRAQVMTDRGSFALARAGLGGEHLRAQDSQSRSAVSTTRRA
jgi:hypothetical protein